MTLAVSLAHTFQLSFFFLRCEAVLSPLPVLAHSKVGFKKAATSRARKTKAKQSLTHFPLNAYLISAKYP